MNLICASATSRSMRRFAESADGLIASIALARLDDRLRFSPAILGKGPALLVDFVEPAFGVAADVPLVFAGIN